MKKVGEGTPRKLREGEFVKALSQFRTKIYIFLPPFSYLNSRPSAQTILYNFKSKQLKSTYIPLTNRVRGPYRKLRKEFFRPRFIAQARSARAINRRGKKRGSVTYSTERETRLVRYLLYLYCVSEGLGNDSYSRGTASNF